MKDIRMRIVAFSLIALLGSLVLSCGSEDNSPAVPELNQPPVLSSQSDTTTSSGDTLHLWASATDPEGDPLSYSVATLGSLSDFKHRGYPDTEINEVEGHFIFRAKDNDRPNREFQFTVKDDKGASHSMSFTVQVQ